MSNKSKEIIKKNTVFAIAFYWLINTVISIVLIGLEIGIILINKNISTFIENPIYIIISRSILSILTVYIFIRIFKKRYILQESKESFLHKFYIVLVIISILSFSVNTINGQSKLEQQLYAIDYVQDNLQNSIINDIDEFEKLASGTKFEKCKDYDEIRNIAFEQKKEAIYNQLIKNNVCLGIDVIIILISMEFFIKREENFTTI